MKNVIAALTKAKLQFKPLKKSGFNKFLNYEYSTLSDVHAAVDVGLAQNGLACVFTFEDEKLTLTLWHESGESLSSSTTLLVERTKGRDGKEQSYCHAWGSVITYTRRYLLESLLGLSAEEDDDAQESVLLDKKETISASVSRLSDEQVNKLMDVARQSNLLDSSGEIGDKLKISITAKTGLKSKIKSLGEIPPEKYELVLAWLPTVKLD
jgi:hypothetical protein